MHAPLSAKAKKRLEVAMARKVEAAEVAAAIDAANAHEAADDRPFLTFRPGCPTGGESHATTWAEVDAFANEITVPWTLYVDSTYGAPEVPADTDFRLLVTMKGGTGTSTAGLLIKDGGKLRNISAVSTAFGIVAEAITTPAIYIDLPPPSTNLLQLREGGTIENTIGVSLVPVIEVNVANSVIAIGYGGSLRHSEPSVPMINFTAIGGFQVIPITLNTSGQASPLPANSFQADPTTTVFYFTDNTVQLASQALFAGAVVTDNISLSAALNWSNGDTASRPANASTGQMYFDTELVPSRAIWWNGTIWVDAAGLAV